MMSDHTGQYPIPDNASEQLLKMLYSAAIDGDLRAAKLFLDYSLRLNLERNSGLTLEQALSLIKNETGDDEG